VNVLGRLVGLVVLGLSAAGGGAAAPPVAAAALPPVHFFDMTYLHDLDRSDPVQARQAWDTAHAVASVQGIANRRGPQLFVRFMPDPDDFWFEYLTGEGQWLAGREVIRHESLEALLTTFQRQLRGVVVYDERVWATSNVASTIAGAESRVCLRYDPRPGSVYEMVMGLGLPFTEDVRRLMNEDGSPLFDGEGEIPSTADSIAEDAPDEVLVPSTGSAKCDAYEWARRKYLDAGRCSPDYLAFYLDAYWLTQPLVSGFDNATLTNHDFFIAQRAFFFDLHVWDEEAPVDDPGQAPGTDVATLRGILQSMHKHARGRIFQIGGFTPWAWKYTDHGAAGGKHGGVNTEWQYARLISAYNGVMDADALGCSGMANASFYQHYPLKDRYPQNPKPTATDLEGRGLILPDGSVAPKTYVCFYMGDYDSAAWFNRHVPKWWADPTHGTTVCTWAFNPNLDRRAPHAMDYVRTHQAPTDWFVFGDSGAGYLNPGMLRAPRPESGLPDGLEAWVEHNLPYAERYDLSITGFVIDGHAPGMGDPGLDAYARFSPDGLVGQKIPPQGLHRDTMPYVRMRLDLHGSPEDAGARLAKVAGINQPAFVFVRTILQSPSWHQAVMARTQALDPDITFVDPYTFFLLLKVHERNRAADTSDRSGAAFVAPDQADGLAPVWVEDGPFTATETAGAPALVQGQADTPQYLYFEVADDLSRRLQYDIGYTVTVERLWPVRCTTAPGLRAGGGGFGAV